MSAFTPWPVDWQAEQAARVPRCRQERVAGRHHWPIADAPEPGAICDGGCWHLLTLHTPGGCQGRVYPRWSLEGEPCPCDRLPGRPASAPPPPALAEAVLRLLLAREGVWQSKPASLHPAARPYGGDCPDCGAPDGRQCYPWCARYGDDE